MERYKIKQKLQRKILEFITSKSLSDLDREYLAFSLYYSEGARSWGSLVRGTLVVLLSDGCESAYKNAIGIEFIHHGSLIIDDIIDRAVIRRGTKSFWVRFGENDAILFAHKLINYAYSNLDLSESIFKTVDLMLYSELLAQKITIRSIEDYIELARLRTGKFFGLTLDLAKRYNLNLDLNYFMTQESIEKIGIAHQMLDDQLDYSKPEFFESNEAFENERRKNYLVLQKFGYSKNSLKKIHYEMASSALRQLDKILRINYKKQVIDICHTIAFGNLSNTMPKRDWQG